MNDRITTLTHLYISIASMFVAWFLCCLPMMKIVNGSYGLIIFSVIMYCIVLPSIVVGTGAIQNNISGETIFTILKLVIPVGFEPTTPCV